MKFLYIFILVAFQSAVAKTSVLQTEANFSAGSRSLDFCCDREYKTDSAHSLSEMESQRIVSNLLSENTDSSIKKTFEPVRGQR